MRRRICAALLALGLLALAGCQKAPEPVEFTTFAMDTVMNFTLYGEKKQTADTVKPLLTGGVSALDKILSATEEGSDIARLNRRGTGGVGAETAEVLAKALELCEVTGGALDITAYPAVKAWGFTQEEHRVPSPAELEALAEKIDYAAVKLEGGAVSLPEGVEMDLGAVEIGRAHV